MINIRTITYNLPKKFGKIEFDIMDKCINEWNKNKYLIRTTRISTVPINTIPKDNYYDPLEEFCDNHNINWYSIPVNLNSKKQNELIDFSYNMIKTREKVFINIDGVKDSNMYFDVIDKYIDLMNKVAHISENGKDNFRLGLSINTIEDEPFFPFAKSSGIFSFTIGLELTQEINKIIDENSNCNFEELRKKIITKIDKQITEIEKYAEKVSRKYHIQFKGFDFSLAPYMEENGSIIELIEKLGIKVFDGPGIMFVTSFLTNILKSFGNKHKKIGFSGVMYSLLEDYKLCEINNNKAIYLEDLIKLSTMCGCGIDMIPIKDSVSKEVLKSYILDIAAISCRLEKPLGVRFLPIPNNPEYTSLNEFSNFITNTKLVKLNKNTLITNGIKEFKFLDINKTVL